MLLLLTMPRDMSMFDESIILSGAMRVLNGDVVHRDFYTLYGPAQFYVVAFVLKLSGNSFLAARMYDLVVRAAITATLFVVLRRQCSLTVASLFTGVCGIWMMVMGSYLYPIFPCILLSLLAASFVARCGPGRPAMAMMFGAGVCAGFTALFRYETGFFLVVANAGAFILVSWGSGRQAGWFRHAVAGLVAYGVGTALVFGPAAAAFMLVSSIEPFKADIFDYSTRYYAEMRGLPFPGFGAEKTGIADYAVYLPLLAVVLAGADLLWPRVGSQNARPALDRRSVFLIVFGFAALLLFLKGVVRASPVHMMPGIIPALAVLAVLVERWRMGRRGLRIMAFAIVAVAALPAAREGAHFARANMFDAGQSVIGWLLVREGLLPSSSGPDACETAPASDLARLDPDYARMANYIAAHTDPNEPVVMALARHDKIFMNPIGLYFAAGRQPGTHWHEFDPGLQTRADIQTLIIAELQSNHVRWVVRDATYDNHQEANGSARSSGVKLLDAYLDEHYRPVAASGLVSAWLVNGAVTDGRATGPCEAAPAGQGR